MTEPGFVQGSISVIGFDDHIEIHTRSDTTVAETCQVLDRLVDWPLLPRLWVLDDHLKLSGDEMASVGKYARQQNLPIRAALVARSDLAYGLARLHLVYRADDEERFSLHRSYDDALEWIKRVAA